MLREAGSIRKALAPYKNSQRIRLDCPTQGLQLGLLAEVVQSELVECYSKAHRSDSVDFNRYIPIDKCPRVGLNLIQSCPTAAVVVNG